MPITAISRDTLTQTVSIVRILAANTLAEVATAGYLTAQNDIIIQINKGPFEFLASDLVLVSASDGNAFFEFINGDFANLVQLPGGNGAVTLPVVSGNFATFNGTLGGLHDSGFTPSNPADPFVVMSPGALTTNHIAQIADANGSIKDGGVLGTMAAQSASAVAITGGTIVGITDLAVADGGTGASTAPLALTSLGLKRAITAAYAGGGTSNAFTATGLLSTDIVTASILASTSSVSITKAVPTADTLTITFSADPGAGTTVQWHAVAP